MNDQNENQDDQTGQTEVQDEKKKSTYETMEAQLRTNRVAIDLALEDTTLHAPLLQFGYDQERIREGEVKVAFAEENYHKQIIAYEAQHNATLLFNDAWKEADDFYVRLVKVARVAFKDNPGIYNQLHLTGDRARSFDDWVPQTTHFYHNALDTPEIVEGFARFNVAIETLTRGRELLEKSRKNDKENERLKAEAQKATDLRDQAFADMNSWMADFIKIARLAFENDRQQLEKFGIVA